MSNNSNTLRMNLLAFATGLGLAMASGSALADKATAPENNAALVTAETAVAKKNAIEPAHLLNVQGPSMTAYGSMPQPSMSHLNEEPEAKTYTVVLPTDGSNVSLPIQQVNGPNMLALGKGAVLPAEKRQITLSW